MKEIAVVFEIFVSELSTKLHRHFHDEDEADLQEALMSVSRLPPCKLACRLLLVGFHGPLWRVSVTCEKV
jgi:hypothetical protein